VTRARRLLASGLTLVLLFTIAPAVAADDLGQDLQTVRKRIESLSGQIDSVTSNRSSLAREIQETQERMDEVLASLTSLRSELLAVESDLVQKERALLCGESEPISMRVISRLR
jgi:septal ring factor EnvC (AmiA/AmiB activator)